MGRPILIKVGDTNGTWRVLDNGAQYKGTNRLLTVQCCLCGTAKTIWNTAYRTGKGRCDTCASKVNRYYTRMGASLPVFAVYHDHVDVHYNESNLPVDSLGLFKLISPELAKPYLPKERNSARSIPEADLGYTYYLKVPTRYVDYYCGISDLPPLVSVNADIYFDERVCTPHEGAISEVYKGSAQEWMEDDGNKYSYIYWKDHNTWPKTYPTPESYVPPPVRKGRTMTPEQLAAYQAKLMEDMLNSGEYKVAEVNRLERLISSTKTHLRENPSPETEAAHAEAVQAHQKAHQALQDHVAAANPTQPTQPYQGA